MTKNAQTTAKEKAAKAAAAAAAKKASADVEGENAVAAKPAERPSNPAVITPSKAKYVTVASKLPMSITLQLCGKQIRRVPGQNGYHEETIFVPQGRGHIVRGTAYPNGTPPKGFPKRPDMVEDDNGGYALTPGIPADFMTAWMEQNAETDMVRNGMIKVQPDLDSLADDCREHESANSGLGPLVPDTDYRNPKPMNAGVSDVTISIRGAA